MSESFQPTSAPNSVLLDVVGLESGPAAMEIVRGASMHVNKGEVVALLGPNGAGKTTLLETIAGVIRPTAGSIELGGIAVAGHSIEQMLDAGLAYVPQVGNVFPSMTVREMLAISYRGQNLEQALTEVLELFPQLKPKMGTRCGLMSGGERQMAAIARAVIRRPFDLLLLDEPSSGLSVGNVRAIFERISTIRDQGVSVLVVEQNATKALEICDRGYVLENGSIVLTGRREELLESSQIREHYLGVR